MLGRSLRGRKRDIRNWGGEGRGEEKEEGRRRKRGQVFIIT